MLASTFSVLFGLISLAFFGLIVVGLFASGKNSKNNTKDKNDKISPAAPQQNDAIDDYVSDNTRIIDYVLDKHDSEFNQKANNILAITCTQLMGVTQSAAEILVAQKIAKAKIAAQLLIKTGGNLDFGDIDILTSLAEQILTKRSSSGQEPKWSIEEAAMLFIFAGIGYQDTTFIKGTVEYEWQRPPVEVALISNKMIQILSNDRKLSLIAGILQMRQQTIFVQHELTVEPFSSMLIGERLVNAVVDFVMAGNNRTEREAFAKDFLNQNSIQSPENINTIFYMARRCIDNNEKLPDSCVYQFCAKIIDCFVSDTYKGSSDIKNIDTPSMFYEIKGMSEYDAAYVLYKYGVRLNNTTLQELKMMINYYHSGFDNSQINSIIHWIKLFTVETTVRSFITTGGEISVKENLLLKIFFNEKFGLDDNDIHHAIVVGKLYAAIDLANNANTVSPSLQGIELSKVVKKLTLSCIDVADIDLIDEFLLSYSKTERPQYDDNCETIGLVVQDANKLIDALQQAKHEIVVANITGIIDQYRTPVFKAALDDSLNYTIAKYLFELHYSEKDAFCEVLTLGSMFGLSEEQMNEILSDFSLFSKARSTR